ncbi:uncharacterized protein [Temnothorax longispinosus]|uniref:uncharacterized protein n=1 Tax=Temnothorax longispinosus TaxID=300112 RepID=UPI003A9987A4
MILNTLRSHNCLSYLPKDVRTLLKTPRMSVKLRNVPPGEYLHTAGITNSLRNVPRAVIPECLEIDFSTDGATLDKSGQIQIWPIQCRIANISNSRPEIVGIYRGKRKPLSAVEFFQDFVVEVNTVISDGGIMFEGSRLPIALRCFIADAPARAFVLNHKGHTSFHPCSKCKMSGEFHERRPVFLGIDNVARTDKEYAEQRDKDHKQGDTPLSHLPIGMVRQVPYESMHLLYIGIGKKLMSAWVSGQYSISSRLPSSKVAEISARLIYLVQYYPRDFNRPPRPIEEYPNYKATEILHFLLYTGPVILNGVLPDELHQHFLLLHTALRCLSSASLTKEQLRVADLALRLYVRKCPTYYGISFMSFNVHGLLHVVEDVKILGPLELYSALAYKNNMRIFRRYCKKPHLPLQQIARRKAEESNCHDRNLNRKSLRDHQTSKLVTVRKKHNTGPIPKELSGAQQYSELQTQKFTLGL